MSKRSPAPAPARVPTSELVKQLLGTQDLEHQNELRLEIYYRCLTAAKANRMEVCPRWDEELKGRRIFEDSWNSSWVAFFEHPDRYLARQDQDFEFWFLQKVQRGWKRQRNDRTGVFDVPDIRGRAYKIVRSHFPSRTPQSFRCVTKIVTAYLGDDICRMVARDQMAECSTPPAKVESTLDAADCMRQEYLKKNGRPLVSCARLGLDQIPTLPDLAAEPYEGAITSEERELFDIRMRAALEKQPLERRKAIEMIRFEGRSVAETAKQLRIPRKTISYWLAKYGECCREPLRPEISGSISPARKKRARKSKPTDDRRTA